MLKIKQITIYFICLFVGLFCTGSSVHSSNLFGVLYNDTDSLVVRGALTAESGYFESKSPGDVPLTVKGAVNQLSHLIQVYDNSETDLLHVWNTGHISNLEGIDTDAAQYGPSILTQNFGEKNPLHMNGIGSYDHTGGVQEMLFTKTVGDDFTQEDADLNNHIVLLGANAGAMAKIRVFIDADNVIVDGMNWNGDLTSQSFYIFTHPVFTIGDGNEIEFSVNGDGKMEIHSHGFTGEFVFAVELDSDVDNQDASKVVADANGHTNIVGKNITYNAGDLQPGDVGAGAFVLINDVEATSADATTSIAAYPAATTGVSDATVTAFLALPGFTNALIVQGADAEEPDYGYETTLTVSVDRVNSGGGGDDAFLEASGTDVTILENAGDEFIVGSDASFEIAQIILATPSSHNVEPIYCYTTAVGWSILVVDGDTTNGMQQSGAIIFTAPGDFAKYNQDLDGNAITNAFYICGTRTRVGVIPTLPVEDFFKTFASQATGMLIDGHGFIQPRVSTDANAPNSKIYESTDQNAVTFKDSVGGIHPFY